MFVRLVDDNSFELIVIPYHRADTSVFACNHKFQLFHLFFRIVHRIRIKTLQHSVDAVTNHFIAIKSVYIHQVKVLVDNIQHIQILCHRKVMVLVFLCRRGESKA